MTRVAHRGTVYGALAFALAVSFALACRDVSPTPPSGCAPGDCGGSSSTPSDTGGGGSGDGGGP
ncbi:MAG TPA: hypothetical protein VGM56_33785 [Byssovorax sp.]|jgi:hypothetical protein